MTCKVYIMDVSVCYSAEMSTNMKHNFKLVTVSGNAYNAVTSSCLEEDYRTTMLICRWPLPPKGIPSDSNTFMHIQDDTSLQFTYLVNSDS